MVIVVSIIPLWWLFPFANSSSWSGILLGAGQASALIGIVLLSINFWLSARFFWVEKMFKGLNKVYVFHHWIGAVSFSLLLIHPMAILLSYALISIGLALDTLVPSLQNLPVFAGSLALILMTILMILTLFIKLPYHIWKKTHQYLGLVLFLAGIHGLLIGSTLSFSLPLKIYVFSWVGIGLISYLTRIFNVRLNLHKYLYVVNKIEVIKNFIVVELIAKGKAMSYLRGQFVFIKFSSLGVSNEEHPFSIAGKSDDINLTIVIKSLGDYTETLKLLKPGSEALIEGPYGRFNYKISKFKKQIWIAGGIGITPFRNMVNEAVNNGYEIAMYYVVSKAEEGLFNEEIKNLSSKNINLRYILWIGDEKGRITAEKIKQLSGNTDYCEIFICGPVPMMKSLASQFNLLGVKNARIHTEEFGLY